ncbi:MAG: hypothetical protein AAGB05_02715 [Pseudomonadota bacterium]
MRRFRTGPLLLCAMAASLAVNVVLLQGGRTFEAAAAAHERLTGQPSIVTRHAEEIARMSDALATEDAARQVLYGKIAELSNTLRLEREINRSIRARYTILSDELNALRAEAAVPRGPRGPRGPLSTQP